MVRISDAAALARAYLEAMEARDFERARSFLAPDFEMLFPGGHRPANLEALAANSGRRYRRIAKRFEGSDLAGDDAKRVVYWYGMLYGEWLDGTPFDDIRFIDRFEIEDGKIARQWVWNDSGEARMARAENEPG